MARLTQSDRDRIRQQLLAALAPTGGPDIQKLAEAAFAAVLADYYGAKTLKQFAAMPAEWFRDIVNFVHVKPTGDISTRTVYGPGLGIAAPRVPPADRLLGEAAQMAVNRWAGANDADRATKANTAYRIDTILSRVTTLEALLTALPQAREILKLPAAKDVESAAAEINAALAARKPARPAGTAKPAAPRIRRPARKRAA